MPGIPGGPMGPNNVSENTVRKALAALAAAAVITVSGVAVATLSSTGATFSVPVLLPDGTESAPSLAQSADAHNGLRFGTDAISLSTAGSNRVTFGRYNTDYYQPFYVSPGNKSGTPAAAGAFMNVGTSTFTDNNTAGSGTAALFTAESLAGPTLAATNTSVTTTDAATLYLTPVVAGTNETISNIWALYATGAIRATGLTLTGDISAAGGWVQNWNDRLPDIAANGDAFGTTTLLGSTAGGSFLRLTCWNDGALSAGTYAIKLMHYDTSESTGTAIFTLTFSSADATYSFKTATATKDSKPFDVNDRFYVWNHADAEKSGAVGMNCTAMWESGI